MFLVIPFASHGITLTPECQFSTGSLNWDINADATTSVTELMDAGYSFTFAAVTGDNFITTPEQGNNRLYLSWNGGNTYADANLTPCAPVIPVIPTDPISPANPAEYSDAGGMGYSCSYHYLPNGTYDPSYDNGCFTSYTTKPIPTPNWVNPNN